MRTLRSLIIFLLVAGLLTWAVVAAVNRRSNKSAAELAPELLAVPTATATPTPAGYVAATPAPAIKATPTPAATAAAKATATPKPAATKVAVAPKGSLPKTGAADGALVAGVVSLAGVAAFSTKNALARRSLKKAYRAQTSL